MPRATVSLEPEHHELKTLLPDGWIKLRRMSYGERLHRADLTMTMAMEADARSKSTQMEIKQTQTQVVLYELATCVIDHNLEDEKGRKLNLKSVPDVQMLDPRVGEEISSLIDDMHDWEKDLPNSEQRSTASSTGSVDDPAPVPSTTTSTSSPAS